MKNARRSSDYQTLLSGYLTVWWLFITLSTDMNAKALSTSLLRGLDVLSLIARAEEGLSIGEIGNRLSLARTTALRFVVTLQQYGLVEKTGSRYGITSRFSDWTQHDYHDVLKSRYRKTLESIGRQVEELTFIGIVEGANVRHVDYVQAAHAIVVDPNPLKHHPLERTAMGKLVIGQRADLLASVAGNQPLLKEIQEASQRGVAWNRGETSPDLMVVATWAASPSAISPMIGIAWPKFRFSKSAARAALDIIRSQLALLDTDSVLAVTQS